MSPTNGIPVVVSHKDVVAAAPSVTPEAAAQIVKQVKHYFSDANLNHDNFMRDSVSSNSGWIDFKVLARFNRLRQLMGIPVVPKQKKANNWKNQKSAPKVADVDTQYVTLLGETIKAGVTEEDLVEIKEDGSAIRRKEAFVPSDEWFSRTVHVKGLPYGVEGPDFIEKLSEYFAGLGNVQLVRMRRNPKTGDFKGNLLVEYATAEEAEEVAKRDDGEYLGNKLEFVMLPAYHDEKVANGEFIQGELRKPGETYQSFEDYCISKGRPLPSSGKNANSFKFPELAPGCLVKFTGVTGGVSYNEIRKAFNASHRVRSVEYTDGGSEGIVRFFEPVAASFIESHPDGQTVGEVKLSVELVDEEGEKAFVERGKAAAEGKSKPKPTSKPTKIELAPGCLVKFTSASGDVPYDKIKEALKDESEVKFVEYTNEKTEGIIRLTDPIAAKIIESRPDGLTIGEIKVSLEPVDEEGEKAFAERAQAAIDNKAAKKRSYSDNRRGGHGHGGNKRFRK
ncbi:hypothetical protein GGI15_003741 [Coemansia interrupta]|uniref:Uncharacterized protein n=1 Tax=Coemansia interrupta TaxID=1126814 RepID=A0A9W8H836_9FUNG|nr:hypothetical protein GGI15_003741 [Coemansia interrupta]